MYPSLDLPLAPVAVCPPVLIIRVGLLIVFCNLECPQTAPRDLRPFELRNGATWLLTVYATPSEQSSCRNVNCMVIPSYLSGSSVKDNIAVHGRGLWCADAEERRVFFDHYIFMSGAAGSSRRQVVDPAGPRLTSRRLLAQEQGFVWRWNHRRA